MLSSAALSRSASSGTSAAAGFGHAVLSERTPRAFWCASKRLCVSQLFAVGLQRTI